MHILESCTVTWTQQITRVLQNLPPTFMYPGDVDTGTKAEFSFWKASLPPYRFPPNFVVRTGNLSLFVKTAE